MNRQMLGLAAIGVVLLAGVAGWFRPIPRPATTATTQRSAWHLPTSAELERSSIAQFAAIRGVAWAGDGGAGIGDPSAQWTLRGILGLQDRVALIQSGSDPLVRSFRPGDTLPDRSKLVAVGRDSVVVDRDGCRTNRPLHPLSKNDRGGECAPPGTDKETPPP